MSSPPASREPPAASAPAPRARVIYVMGAGRSGSTILGVALGNCPGVFYAGELDAWLRLRGVPNFNGSARTSFWDAIRERLASESDLFGEEPWRTLEHSLALLRPHRWRRRAALRVRYAKVMSGLYGAVSERSRASWIIDSSHYPLRARELQRIAELELYLIYLVRAPGSVIASFSRMDVSNPAKGRLLTEAYLALTHLLSAFVFLTQPRERRLFVRYEDFAAEPERVLALIANALGLAGPVPDMASLQTGLPFQGNRLLENERICFRRAPAPQPPAAGPITGILQLPFTLVHRRLRPSAAPARPARTHAR